MAPASRLGVDAGGMAVPLLACVALYWRRRFPAALAVALVVLATAWPTDVPLLVALFTVAAGRPGRVTAGSPPSRCCRYWRGRS